MFGPKIKLPQHIIDKVRIASELSGAASIEEFAASALEAAADKIITSSSKKEASASEIEDIANKLKGLGYLE